jgi:hypothetical protein
MKYLLPIIGLLFFSCATNHLHLNKINGVFIHEEYKNLELHFENGSFTYLDTNTQKHLPTFKCCDTIAVGKYKLETENLISISSLESLNFSYLHFDTKEKQDSSKDSLVFIIDNPIEEHYKKYNEKFRELYYNIEIQYKDKYIEILTDKNPVFIKKEGVITEFEITIYPKYDIPIREVTTRKVYTLPYKVLDEQSNIFNINITNLDYEYLCYKRLNQDYIKVVNKNKLLWDGVVYTRK